MTRTLLNRHEVQHIVKMPRSTLYQAITEGDFPRPIRVGKRSVRWSRTRSRRGWRAASAPVQNRTRVARPPERGPRCPPSGARSGCPSAPDSPRHARRSRVRRRALPQAAASSHPAANPSCRTLGRREHGSRQGRRPVRGGERGCRRRPAAPTQLGGGANVGEHGDPPCQLLVLAAGTARLPRPYYNLLGTASPFRSGGLAVLRRGEPGLHRPRELRRRPRLTICGVGGWIDGGGRRSHRVHGGGERRHEAALQ